MILSKHSQHRNRSYLQWLRNQSCAATCEAAEVAHHIRLGTNGGKGLKPSDYFCIPLKESHHTLGTQAIHRIGEASFFKLYNLQKEVLFVKYLSLYLEQAHSFSPEIESTDLQIQIASLINSIEGLRLEPTRSVEKKTKMGQKKKPKSEHQIKREQEKKKQDKELRKSFSDREKINKTPKMSENPLYQKAQEQRRLKARELREKHKERLSNERKEQYQKAKQYRKDRQT
ncbi:MAG: DUF968 domain-containing protein [Halobacteriovoraceae bacterium]|jgi:hypothetical protein|nr:DUF968 domain-containing protein [Halobacteriovoraceae bacterium]